MALKNLFDMAKADKYTADGRETLIKAQEAETEDARRTYQIGEISEATGLQKTAQGWKPPKETKFGKVKQNKEGQWGVQTKQGKGSDFLKHKSEKEASRALANYTAGYNTTERSKQDPHSDYARQQKQWNKETDRMRKNSNAERRAEHASQFAKKLKPGSVINNAREQSESFKKQKDDYLEAYRNETNEERKGILSSLAFNSEKQRSLYEGIADYNDSVGGWKINNGTANKLHDLQEEQMRLETKLKNVEATAAEPGPDRDDSPERAAYERELSRQQTQRAADDPRGFGYEEPPMEPAAPRNEIENVGGENRPYRIKGTQFYFNTPEEAENAILAKNRGGATYARPSQDTTVNNIQESLGFKLDTPYGGKHSMDDFMKKTGENEYAVNVWSFGTDSKGTLINPLSETDKPNATIKKENGEWKLHYKDRDGKETVVTANGRQDPTRDAAPRVLTGDTKIRVRKA